MPPCSYAPIELYAPIHSYTPRGVHTPIIPPYSSVHLCVFGGFACCGGGNGLPFVLGHLPYTPPVWGCLLFNYTPLTQLLVPCVLVCFRDISMLCGHIYPKFTGKVSSLTHFPLEPGCEDYAFLDQAVADLD